MSTRSRRRSASAPCGLVVGALAASGALACGGGRPGHGLSSGGGLGGGDAAMSRAADAQMVHIPAGQFIAGSTLEERAAAYDAFLASAGHDGARERGWFEREADRHLDDLPAFALDLAPVTQAQYGEFVAATGHRAPTMDQATWTAQGFVQDWASEVARYVWTEATPPPGREQHPVVLVSWDDAGAYCAWRGELVGSARRLPSAAELEKAARGAGGLIYPWGNGWDPTALNSAVAGPGDTVPVGSHRPGGDWAVLDLAGNVFQWTSTPWPIDAGAAAPARAVKGSAWDDHAGVGRGASIHGRPRQARHVIVGFRCAGPVGAE